MTDRGPLTKRQARAAATGEQLLAAARGQFESQGYAATTVGAITKAANTAHGTFYLHFRNKEDAFFRVMGSVLDEMYVRTTLPDGVPSIEAAVHLAVHNYLEVFQAHRGLWRSLLEGMLQNRSIESVWLEMRQPFIKRIAATFTTALEAGRARPVAAEHAATALCAMCEWFAFTNFSMEGPGAGSDFDTVVKTLADLWYHAVFLDGEDPGSRG